ncbi:energy-coupling factor transporter transmembrane protein EcfT [Bacillus sp. HMF5848]|uniref:energy-coupling factor transporter transmembrane component T family protein n=1 Tax=Bacillus sp. HMF5848 TaxID=2495421 RepID=UPI000F7A1020|nr:energy-coupling factor transporter transmembrane protein EcfT [Bacillus sp. HMF5848]RSK25578.1 energy-coupling factor transporter transmembrane protein EcfT [Bacillus sp. HMF5848]
MMDSIIIGKYVHGDSFIHRLDPRTKLLLVFLFVFIVFLANNILTYGLLGLYTLAIVLNTKIPLSFIWRGLKPILWIVLFTFLIHVIFTKEGSAIFSVGNFTIFSEGVRQGTFLALRFLYLIVITTLLTLTTTPIEITDGMESLLKPFQKFGLPVHELALMMSISLRFIPTLMQETDKIMKAQKARGADFATGSLRKRVQAIVPLLVPLFVGAFKRAEELATAMEARGYQGGEGRTKYRELTWERPDALFLLLFAVVTLLLIMLRS